MFLAFGSTIINEEPVELEVQSVDATALEGQGESRAKIAAPPEPVDGFLIHPRPEDLEIWREIKVSASSHCVVVQNGASLMSSSLTRYPRAQV